MDSLRDDEELFSSLELINEKVPFHNVLGIKVKSMSFDRVQLLFKMRDEFIGNYFHGSLHGGVISSIIDVTGGYAAFLAAQKKRSCKTLEEKLSWIRKLGTINLRVDYLRPGLGNEFVSTAYNLKTGKKVAVVRIELHNDSNELIAVGTGSYNIA
ncbi:uncharacterized domain 1-containing protein [Syntrophus gentianae]|uniref:Medium/long-chain acyl-CoA thioesterase YigI n=1 Tax=Syntrophus gentianae TaxID=43775 RepID=A0A1H7ZKP8_9BACT|nr:thioesterase family protein [Syntrophus gentianae]SEM58138.1 uncharacterized domain 1-containing protein [Syntrophus gentianae]